MEVLNERISRQAIESQFDEFLDFKSDLSLF